MRCRLAVVAGVLLLSTGCAPRGPIAGAVVPDGTGGTIAGMVSAEAEAEAAGAGKRTVTSLTPLPARKVTAVNTETGERYEASTGANGGYTIKVPAGRYRLELELQSGETLVRQPDPTQVGVGDLDADRDFVVRK